LVTDALSKFNESDYVQARAPARSCVQAQTARYHSKWSYIVNYSTVT